MFSDSLFTNVYLWEASGAVIIFFLTAIVLLTNEKVHSGNKNYTIAILALSVGVFVSLSVSYHSFIVDDVYISLRYARNLAAGHGLVFNTDGSPPVEGYTNFLWVVMEAPFFSMGIPEDHILKIIRFAGIAFGIGILIATFYLIRLMTFDHQISLTGVLFLSAVPELSFWATGGLETTMYIFWLLAGIYRYIVEKRKNKLHIWSIFFFVLMALTRPEGLFFVGGVIIWDVLWTLAFQSNAAEARRNLKQILAGVITFAILYGVYFLWRYNFYGHLFPNTYYAKKLTNTSQMVHRFKQVSSFVVWLFPFFSIACLGYFHFKKPVTREKQFLLSIMVLLILFCFAARNEWMPGFRYELPFVPLLMLFFAAGLIRILYSNVIEPGSRWKTHVVQFATMFFLGIYLLYDFHNLNKEGNDLGEQLHRAHVPLGKWLKKHAPKDASYASWDMGAVPFYSELPHIIDINSEGLLNTYTTQRGYDVNYLLSLEPSFLVLPPNTSYVRPRDILDFYSNKKLNEKYELLFIMSFTQEYLLNVYRRRDVVLSDAALKEGIMIAQKSKASLD